MARQSAWQRGDGHRFLTRRMEHALVRRDFAMHDDVLRTQSRSLLAGCVLAALAIAGCAILALIRPQGAIGDAPIVMARETGALYVRIDDTLHPVLNLASARLVAGSAANPVTVGEADIANAKRGSQVGISGAPATIGMPLTDQSWTVCDDDDLTVVVIGADASAIDRLDHSRSVLVTPRGEVAAPTYLLYEGRRSEVDLRSNAVVRALRIDGVVPLRVSRALLDLVPEAPAIAVPAIDRAGTAGPKGLAGVAVGTVVKVARAESSEFYVVLSGGVQRIGEVAADLIRFALPGRFDEVPTVAPSAIAETRVVSILPVEHLPDHAGVPVGADTGLSVCAHWRNGGSDARSNTIVLTGESAVRDLHDSAVALGQADGDGPNVDRVVVPAGHCAYVRSVGILGDDGTAGTRFLVNDEGVVFGIRDGNAASRLGLSEAAALAPWPVLARLPRGPELSSEAASILRDAVSPPA
jgi:type VII secretion protein EccB